MIGFGVNDVSPTPAVAANGKPFNSTDPEDFVSAGWRGGTVTDVWTLNIGTVAAQAYGFDAVTPDGESYEVRHTAAGTETKNEIVEAVRQAARAFPGLTQWVTLTDDDDDLIITSQLAGTAGAVAVTESLANQTLAHTATAADAQTTGPGRLVGSGGLSGALALAKPLGTVLTAQSATITVVYEASKNYVVTFDGTSFTEAADTDSATTAGNIATALSDIVPSGVTVTDNADGTITVAADKKGDSFSLEAFVIDATTGSIAVTGIAAPTFGYDLGKTLLGIVGLSASAKKAMDGGEPYWDDGQDIPVQRKRSIWVAVSGSYTLGGDLFVDMSGGANDGLVYTTTGASRVQIPPTVLAPIRVEGDFVCLNFVE